MCLYFFQEEEDLISAYRTLVEETLEMMKEVSLVFFCLLLYAKVGFCLS